jgi:hypothetical protein
VFLLPYGMAAKDGGREAGYGFIGAWGWAAAAVCAGGVCQPGAPSLTIALYIAQPDIPDTRQIWCLSPLRYQGIKLSSEFQRVNYHHGIIPYDADKFKRIAIVIKSDKQPLFRLLGKYNIPAHI